MSTCFHLVCHETRQMLWIGQGHGGDMTTFYSGVPETMERLAAFLRTTRGKPLVVMSDHEIDDEQFAAYAELEDLVPGAILAAGPP